MSKSPLKHRSIARSKSPLSVGNSVFIRCVTHYYTGKILEITESEIILEDAAWVADTGRFSDALKSGRLGEVEPFHAPVSIGRGAIVDATTWDHPLPREVK